MFWVCNLIFSIVTLIDTIVVNARYHDKLDMEPVFTFVSTGIYICGISSLFVLNIYTTKRSRYNPRYGALSEVGALMGGDQKFWVNENIASPGAKI
jgi:hypothetical protein